MDRDAHPGRRLTQLACDVLHQGIMRAAVPPVSQTAAFNTAAKLAERALVKLKKIINFNQYFNASSQQQIRQKAHLPFCRLFGAGVAMSCATS